MQGRNTARQLAERTSGHTLPVARVPMPHPQLSTLGPPTWRWPTLGQLSLKNTQETSRVPWYTSQPLNCHLCAWQTFPPKPPEPSMTGCDRLPYYFLPQKKSQGLNPALPTKVPLPWCLSQSLLRRPSLHPYGFSGAVQPPWATQGLGILPPTHSFGLEGTWPPQPNLYTGSPVLSTSPLVFLVLLYWGLPWILSQGTGLSGRGWAPAISWSQDQARCWSWDRHLTLPP